MEYSKTFHGETAPTTVAVCDSQPLTAEGLRAVLEPAQDFRFLWGVDNLAFAVERLRYQPAEILLLDKGFGTQELMRSIELLRRYPQTPALVVWGVSITEAEAVRFFQSGARGVMRKAADVETLFSCLRAVARGETWLEGTVFREIGPDMRPVRPALTPREQQVMELVEQGLKNREIARELGIRPGTVKIHLKHIFEKTGVRGRYGLALSGIRNRPAASPLLERRSA